MWYLLPVLVAAHRRRNKEMMLVMELVCLFNEAQLTLTNLQKPAPPKPEVKPKKAIVKVSHIYTKL